MIKKESRQFNISVEGINCEKMYFEHLAKIINSSERNTYNLKVDPKKMSPLEYAKRNAYKPIEKRRGNKKIPFIHIQDIEDYYNNFQRAKFYGMIDDMRKAEDMFGITYKLGYSNYTFELWMLLHVADVIFAVRDRSSYLGLINRYFHRNYKSIDEYKKQNEFGKILDQFVTLDSVKLAIARAEKIVRNNDLDKKSKDKYSGFTFFRDNPDLSVHTVVQMILEVCEVK